MSWLPAGDFDCPICHSARCNGHYENYGIDPYHWSQQTVYNYKCPACNGEFNFPATDGLSYPKCPWCGKFMHGLSSGGLV